MTKYIMALFLILHFNHMYGQSVKLPIVFSVKFRPDSSTVSALKDSLLNNGYYFITYNTMFELARESLDEAMKIIMETRGMSQRDVEYEMLVKSRKVAIIVSILKISKFENDTLISSIEYSLMKTPTNIPLKTLTHKQDVNNKVSNSEFVSLLYRPISIQLDKLLK